MVIGKLMEKGRLGGSLYIIAPLLLLLLTLSLLLLALIFPSTLYTCNIFYSLYFLLPASHFFSFFHEQLYRRGVCAVTRHCSLTASLH